MPPFLTLAGHPVRWRLLTELARSDRQVAELTDALRQPQGLVSYHLGRLRDGGLVASRRSAFDGRAVYYRVHLERCASSLAAAGAAIHPGLLAGPTDAGSGRTTPPPSVLFLCTGNSSRSQIAEALLRGMAPGAVEVASAGSHPKPIDPLAIEVLAERGIDISGARSKSIEEFRGRRFDHVITLCDKVREVCPEFPGRPTTAHWSIEDPSRTTGNRRAARSAIRAVADDLELRMRYLLPTLHSSSTKEHPRHVR